MSTVREIFENVEYGPAPETEDLALSWLEEHRHTFHPFINGEFAKNLKTDGFYSFALNQG